MQSDPHGHSLSLLYSKLKNLLFLDKDEKHTDKFMSLAANLDVN